MAAILVMPIRGERSTPTFNQKEPNNIVQYFKQLKMLFTQCTITADANKKKYAMSYVKSEVAESWEAIPEFTNTAHTYDNFKDWLLELYNQTALRYILLDLNHLISEDQRLGMHSLQDLLDFHLGFNVISSFLIINQLLSACEQSQAYLYVFDEVLQNRIIMRLQIILPNHHLSLPYAINEAYNAAKWALLLESVMQTWHKLSALGTDLMRVVILRGEVRRVPFFIGLRIWHLVDYIGS